MIWFFEVLSLQLSFILKHRFPAQEQSGGDSKIPSIVIYDQDGAVEAVGAEAVEFEENLDGTIEDNGFTKSAWYTYVHPKTSITLTPGVLQV